VTVGDALAGIYTRYCKSFCPCKFENTILIYFNSSLYNIVLLKKNYAYPQIDFSMINDELSEEFESSPKIEISIFMEIIQIFRVRQP
jgi:hypothetical protein